jgi:regulator of protease activity HflC (stomatin/prohibitin superfamily)
LSLRIVTMPIQSQGIITRDTVSVDVSAVAYFRVVDAVKSVVAIEDAYSAIDQIAQTTLRKVGRASTAPVPRLRSSRCHRRKTTSVGASWRASTAHLRP